MSAAHRDTKFAILKKNTSDRNSVLDASIEKPIAPLQAAATADAAKVTSGSLLARNTGWNLAGQVLPMAVGLFAIPRLIHALGTDRFGVLTIAWMVVGYFSFFDLGLGRAMTNLVAQNLAAGGEDELPAIIWTANLLMGVLGILGAIALVLLSPVLVCDLLKTPVLLQLETTRAFYVLGLSMPFVISTAGFRGILEARQKFRIVNLVKVPMGVATFAAPLLVLPWSKNLTAVVGILVIVRFLFWIAYVSLALRDMPSLLRGIVVDTDMFSKLFSFGAWMTVSNIVAPIMAYLDRFLVGMLLSLTAVAYYATPWEVVTKVLLVPGALVGVLFPAFSTALIADPSRAGMLFRRAVKYVAIVLFPVLLLIVLFARDGLTIWLGSDFAGHSTRVLQWLALGVFANGLGLVPFALVQGAGRADITGKLNLLELPFYLVCVWVLTKHFGIQGTAIAWSLRVIVECILLFCVADRILGKTLPVKSALGGAAAVAAAFVLSMTGMTLPTKFIVYGVALGAFFLTAWFALLIDERRLWGRFRFAGALGKQVIPPQH
jgi:O-antigen/teichoic acid export membrane protein